VLDAAGNGSLYLRDLEFKSRDLFYVGVADLTLSENRTSGPINLLQGANAPQPYDSSLGGRLAFYLNGGVTERWRLTASADTREGPVKTLFSNFLDKSPDSLFRRVDPDFYYPTFGDDGVVMEMAPTQGKFYVKASRGENYGMWGNFKVGYMGNELAHVDRGLYGANAHYASEATTSFGERRAAVDGFAAEPGTLSSYEEFWERAGRSTSCATRISSGVPRACASNFATRTRASSWGWSTCGTAWTTTSITCRAGCCFPSPCRRPLRTTCSCAAAA